MVSAIPSVCISITSGLGIHHEMGRGAMLAGLNLPADVVKSYDALLVSTYCPYRLWSFVSLALTYATATRLCKIQAPTLYSRSV